MKQLLLLSVLLPIFSFSQIGSTSLPVKDMPPTPKKDTVVADFLHRQPSFDKLSKEKKEWFYWTNYSRLDPQRFYDSVINPLLLTFPTLRTASLASLKRDLYKTAPLPMLIPSLKLNQTAQSFADEMADHKASPSHTSPSGGTFQSRMEGIKIKDCAGENISFGLGNPLLMLVLLYIDEGVPNLGHRTSLLTSQFMEMGIGYSRYPDDKHIVIQEFSCRQ